VSVSLSLTVGKQFVCYPMVQPQIRISVNNRPFALVLFLSAHAELWHSVHAHIHMLLEFLDEAQLWLSNLVTEGERLWYLTGVC